jgi:phenylacetic acid degradation operon negative regulatory protein
VFAHPQVDRKALSEILKQTRTQSQVAVLQAQSLEGHRALQTIMDQTFKLPQVAHMWAQFIRRFETVRAAGLAPHEAFYVRTLLIHEYRRVLLRDPNLPAEFLPAAWPGLQGRTLCHTLYRDLLANSERHLITHLQTSQGRLKKTPRAIEKRLTA